MEIVDRADRLEKESEVVSLGEASKLRHVMQPDIHEPLCCRLLQSREESLCRSLREPDRIKPHRVASTGSPTVGSFSTYAISSPRSLYASSISSSPPLKSSRSWSRS